MSEDTRSPQQKAADTRKANLAKTQSSSQTVDMVVVPENPMAAKPSNSAFAIPSKNEASDRTQAYINKMGALKKRKEDEKKKNGKEVVFQLNYPTKSPAVFLSASSSVFIPDDWAQDPYLHDLVEMDSDGNALTGVQRIRYVNGIDAVFVKNQPEEVYVEPIRTTGLIRVNDVKDRPKLKFLRMCGYNQSNPHKNPKSAAKILEYNDERIAEKENEENKARFEAEELVFNTPIEGLYAIATVLKVSIESAPQMKAELRRKAASMGAEFIKLFNSADLPTRERLVIGDQIGVIQIKDRRLCWRDGSVVAPIPPGLNWIEYSLDFAKFDEGIDFLSELDRRIDKALA